MSILNSMAKFALSEPEKLASKYAAHGVDHAVRAGMGAETVHHGVGGFLGASDMSNVGDRVQLAKDVAKGLAWGAGKVAPSAAPALSATAGVLGRAVPLATAAQTMYDGYKLYQNPTERLNDFQQANANAGTGVWGTVKRGFQGLAQPVTSITNAGRDLYNTANTLYDTYRGNQNANAMEQQLVAKKSLYSPGAYANNPLNKPGFAGLGSTLNTSV